MSTPVLAARNCGFCQTRNHDRCPGAIANGNGVILTCPCQCQKLRCRHCKNDVSEEVDPGRWSCLDRVACELRIPVRPSKKIGRKMSEPTTPAPKKVAPRCECGCGTNTKGGRFLPGHDAKLKSVLARTYTQSDDRAATALAKAEAYARGWYKGVSVGGGQHEVSEVIHELIERYGGREQLIEKCVAARYAKNDQK